MAVAVVQALVAAAAAVASVDLQGGVGRPGEPQPVSVEAPSEPSLSTAAFTLTIDSTHATPHPRTQ